MAQPVEIPFSVVRDHKAVRHLNAAAFGAYCRLVMAALWDDVDLAEQNDASLALMAGAHGLAWRRYNKTVLCAVAASLPRLRQTFQKALRKRDNETLRSKKAWIKAYAVRMANKKMREARSFGESQVALGMPAIIQPYKKSDYKSQASDLPSIYAAEKRSRATIKGSTLVEKR